MGLLTPVRSARRPSLRSRFGSQSPHGLLSSNRKKKVYTNEQLSEIYKDCIVKAQQGKINQQNAWNLKLVDNIKEITNLNNYNDKENDGDYNNNNVNNRNNRNRDKTNVSFEAFARASHTIDAASKIYGYRVDSVHNKTYKVLGSIHQQNGDDLGDDGLNGDEINERKRKRQQRNRNVGRSTLCEQDKLYRVSETLKNLCVEVDPLFHKTASCFDEGGAKGLLMNTLYVQNGCDIVFDSSTKIEQNEDITADGVKIDNDLIENQEEIEKENEWMTQLFTDSFGKEVAVEMVQHLMDSHKLIQQVLILMFRHKQNHKILLLIWNGFQIVLFVHCSMHLIIISKISQIIYQQYCLKMVMIPKSVTKQHLKVNQNSCYFFYFVFIPIANHQKNMFLMCYSEDLDNGADIDLFDNDHGC